MSSSSAPLEAVDLRPVLFEILLLTSDPDLDQVDRLLGIEAVASAALADWHPADGLASG